MIYYSHDSQKPDLPPGPQLAHPHGNCPWYWARLFQLRLRRGGNIEHVIKSIESKNDDIKVTRTGKCEANR